MLDRWNVLEANVQAMGRVTPVFLGSLLCRSIGISDRFHYFLRSQLQVAIKLPFY